MYINAPEGCQRGTHTNETAYPLGTYASVHTQTHSSAYDRRPLAALGLVLVLVPLEYPFTVECWDMWLKTSHGMWVTMKHGPWAPTNPDRHD